MGYAAFTICAATFYWDYKLGFESTKYYTAGAVAVYALINVCLTYWIFNVEKGTIYIGTNKRGDKIHISSKTEKYIPIYNLTITTYTKEHPTVPNTISLKKSFTGWFDKAGHFVTLPFQQMFASNVSLIGEADPGRVVAAKKKTVRIEDGKSSDEKWAALLAESSVDLDGSGSSTATPGKAKKRGKKV